MIIALAFLAISLWAAVATVVTVGRDGYGRVPDRMWQSMLQPVGAA